jgi:peptide/nickel transport system permease protein
MAGATRRMDVGRSRTAAMLGMSTLAGATRRGVRWSPGIVVAGAFLLLLVVVAVFAPVFAPHDPLAIDVVSRNLPPGTRDRQGGLPFLLGTDPLGRDTLSRLIFGARISLLVGALSVLLSGLVGVALGMIAGFYRGWIDAVIMRVVDVQMALPSLLIALFVLYVVGGGVLNVVLVLSITRWMVYARVVRSMMLSLRERQFFEGIAQLGASNMRILLRHAVPNVMSRVAVLATLEMATMILTEASLDFLGLGIQPPKATWGLMLAEGKDYITVAWWQITMPGLAILFTALALNAIAGLFAPQTDR